MNEELLSNQLAKELDEELEEEQTVHFAQKKSRAKESKYTLEEINASLLEELEEKEFELEQVKKELESLNHSNQGRDVQSKETERIAILAKKNRTLTMTLNRERARIVKLEQDLNSLTKQLEEEKNKESTPRSSGRQSPLSTTGDASKTRTKTDKLIQKNTELQQQVNLLKSDNIKLKGIIQREVMGVEVLSNQKQIEEFENFLEKLMSGSTDNSETEFYSWRGRAQQIILLKSKVKEWKRRYENVSASPKSSTSSTTGSMSSTFDVDDRNRQQLEKLEHKARVELAETKKEVVEKNEIIADFKLKVEALNARNRTLEKTIQDLKVKLGRVLEKTNTDNKLIEALQTELEKKSKNQDILRTITANSNMTKLRQQFEHLERLLREKEDQIRRLEAMLYDKETGHELSKDLL